MAKSKAAAREAAAWNDRYPVGTPVRYWPVLGGRSPLRGVTRSTAQIRDNMAVIWVTCRGGYVELAHVTPVEKGGE